MESSIMMWGTIIIFNLAILQLLRVTLAQADFRQAMVEKAPPKAIETITTTKTLQPPPADGAVVPAGDQVPVVVGTPVLKEEKITPQAGPAETSYSRVAGMIGAVVLACFVWAVGNVILYKMFVAKPEDVTALVASLGSYFLAGAALFAPYAVNQLGNAFKS